MLAKVQWRLSSSFAALKQLQGARERSIDTQMQKVEEQFQRLTADNRKIVGLALNRLLPVQEARVALVLQELTQLNSFEQRAFFSILEEQRNKGFMTINGEAQVVPNPLQTGTVWPFNHPSNLQFQAEAGFAGQVGLHGLPKAFLAKVESGEAFQSLDDMEVAAAPAEKVEAKVEEVKEEKTSFDLVLKGFAGDAKLKVIKEVKTILNLGLKEAKEKVESSAKGPAVLFKNVSKETVKAQYEKLVAAGAVLEWQ